jgi:hypothetical protein
MVALPIIYSISSRLSETKRVDANILVIEGWLPPYAIEMAYNEFLNHNYDKVITTGIKISGYYQLSQNGYLIFHSGDILKQSGTNDQHIIETDAYSELGGQERAHFNVFINDTVIGSFFAERNKSKYPISWNGDLSGIDSVMVQFDNDRFNDISDRNLYVREIIFDHLIHVSYQHNSEYDIGTLDGKNRIINNFNSHAELARNKLISLGLDSSRILSLPGKKVSINRTLSSALAFRDWLKKSDIEVKGINIVTMGTHAKRTLMTYNKILDKNYEIGIISLPNYRERASRKYKVFKTLRESVGIIYYWFILLPY